MSEIRLTYLQGVETMVGILVRDGYTVKVAAVHKEFPRQKEVAYYLINYEKEN